MYVKTSVAVLSSALVMAIGSVAVAEERKLDLSATIGGTSDYIFRGVSQTGEQPAFQASVDLTYGIFYAGIWGSNTDLGANDNAELDLYAGITPAWGPVTFDLGVIYYAYPSADDNLEYVELKGGYSLTSPWIKGLTSGTTVYWSPEYTLDSGEVVTVESSASYALPAVGKISPTLSGTYGTVYGDLGDGFTASGTGDDEYSYWNVGIEVGLEKFTFDFRYWDTDIDVANANGIACTDTGVCDERFVFSASISLP